VTSRSRGGRQQKDNGGRKHIGSHGPIRASHGATQYRAPCRRNGGAHNPDGNNRSAAHNPHPHCCPHTGGNSTFYGANDPARSRGGQHHNNHRGTVAPETAPHHRGASPKAGGDGGSRYAAGTTARGWGGTKRPSRDRGGRRVTGGLAWAQARAEVQRLWAMGQQLQGEAQTKTTYTGFREVAKMAQDALEAANAASRRARQERMASVGALPLTGCNSQGLRR
jgi:hypothetical protein